MNVGAIKFFVIVAFACGLAQAEIITNVPIEVINPVQIGTDQLEAERVPIGGPDFYKPNVAVLDSGELLLTVMGPAEYTYPDRGGGDQMYTADALLYRSRDGGKTWIESGTLPAGKESHFTVLKNGVIIINAHFVQKHKANPVHYGHSIVHRSEDGGKTWTTKDILMEDMPGAKTTVDLRGARDKLDAIDAARDIFELDDGSIIFRPYGPGRVKEGLEPIGDRKVLRIRNILEVADCTYIAGPWVEIPLVTEDNINQCDIGLMIGSSHNVLEFDDGTLLMAVATREGYERIWVSKDSGKTWKKDRVARFEDFKIEPRDYWCGLLQETFLYKGDTDKIYAILRVDERYFPPLPGTKLPEKGAHGDQSERMVIFESTDGGKNWGNRKNLGTYGEMYPSIIKLQDGRLLLTFTVRSLSEKLGVRAVLGYEDEDGLHFDTENDRIVVEARTPAGLPGVSSLKFTSGGGFGNTVQLADGTLVTPYTYRGEDNKTHAEVVRWKLPAKAN